MQLYYTCLTVITNKMPHPSEFSAHLQMPHPATNSTLYSWIVMVLKKGIAETLKPVFID